MKISGRTQLFAIIGDPVIHSLSPAMQNAWMQAAGIDAVYVPLGIAEEGAERAFAGLRGLGLKGANVTTPHKERAARAADVHDVAVRKLHAANVLTWENDGTLVAFNTDWAGVSGAFDEATPDWRGKTQVALVIGAGGAGRAAVWGLAEAGVANVVVCNRTFPGAEASARLVGGMAVPWAELGEAFANADVIVNATSLGMIGKEQFDWPIERAKQSAIVMDSVYAPRETALLKAAKARGLKTIDGLGMLLHQGAMAFELWFDQRPDIAVGRAALEAAFAERT
ncbi:MAG: shikimate dehydrogenase [Hyphomonadaceae bacterium]|nr:shikimate dehydrogenase [Hyphomonadaceae bacterium]